VNSSSPQDLAEILKKLTRKQRRALAAKIKYRVKRHDPEYMARKRENNRQWMKSRYYEIRKDPEFLPKFRAMRRAYYHQTKKIKEASC